MLLHEKYYTRAANSLSALHGRQFNLAGHRLLLFELYQRQPIVVPVLSSGIVEHLDAAEGVRLFLLASDVYLAPDALAFEELEEALGDRVVVTVAAPAHAAHGSRCFQAILPVVPSELHSFIGVR